MDLNATLLGQMFTFAIFVWFTKRFVWPPVTKALGERQNRIAEGLAAAEKGRQELEQAAYRVKEMHDEAKQKAAQTIENSNLEAVRIIEEAKDKAREEVDRMKALAKSDIEQQYQRAKEELREQVANLVVVGAERILNGKLDVAVNEGFINDLLKQI